VCNVSRINLFGVQLMDLMKVFHALLITLQALFFLSFGQSCMPGDGWRNRLRAGCGFRVVEENTKRVLFFRRKLADVVM